MQSSNFNAIQNTDILPTTNIKVLGAAKNSSSTVKILVTDKAMLMCYVCLSLPEDPVTICKSTETQFFKKHLLCRACAILPETGLYMTTCAVCNQENSAGPQSENSAAEFIAQVKLNSLYICPNSCENFITASNINAHIATCPEKKFFKSDVATKDADVYTSVKICTDCKTKVPTATFTKHSEKCLYTKIIVKVKSSTTGFTAELPVPRWLYNETNYISKVLGFSILKSVNAFTSENYSRVVAYQTELFSLEDLSGIHSHPKNLSFNVYSQYNNQTTFKIPADRKLIEDTKNLSIDIRNKLSISNVSTEILKNLSIPERYRVDMHGNVTHENIYFHKQKFTVAIAPYITDECKYIVYKKTFTQVDISTHYSMYNNGTAPQDFVDLVEFFTDNGIAKNYYSTKYGNNLKWKILVSVKDI